MLGVYSSSRRPINFYSIWLYTLGMPSSKNPNSTIWEQWLQRLQGEYADNERLPEYDRTELIEVLSSPEFGTALYFSRVGSIIAHSISAEVVFIHVPQKQLYFSNVPKRKEIEIKKQFSTISSRTTNFSLLSRKLKNPVALSSDKKLQYYSQILLSKIADREVLLSAISVEPLTRSDVRYLQFVSSLLRFRHQVYLLEMELKQNQSQLTALTQHLSEGLAILNRDLSIGLWNEPMTRLTGYSTRQALKMPFQSILKRADDPMWLEKLLQLYEQQPRRHVFAAEFELETRAKERKWVSLSGTFLRGPDKKIAQVIIISRDISRNKELERRKNEFISIATHELRTPITAVKGYLSMLQKNMSELSDKQKTYVIRANDAIDRLVHLAEDLLQVVHVEEDRTQFNVHAIDLYPIGQKVIGEFSEKAKEKNLTLKIDRPSFSTLSLADPHRTEQVIANLVDNAIKYTPKGTIELRFGISNEKQVSVEVRDTGIGILPRELEGIFEKFHRTSSAKETTESGVGLGLYIVKSFIEKQGGRITVTSRPGRGTSFLVSLPRAEAAMSNKEVS